VRASGSRARSEGKTIVHRSVASAPHRTPGWLALASALALTACDIVQGFQNAGNALFPPVKTYLDVPGSRVLPGNYTSVALLSGEEAYLALRSVEPQDQLTLTHYAEPLPCVLRGIGLYEAFGPPDIDRLVIAYFEGWEEGGTLRFADGQCRELGIAVENARLPVFVGADRRFIVESADTLLAVDPFQNDSVTLAEGVTSIVDSYSFSSGAFVANGLLGVIDSRDSTQVQWFGQKVVAAVSGGTSLFFEDRAGVHELAVTSLGDTILIAERRVERRACHLARLPFPELNGALRRTDWIGYNVPCESTNFVVRDPQQKLQRSISGHAIDARYAKVVAAGDATALDSPPTLADPIWVFYLTDVDLETGEGDLHALDVLGDTNRVLGRTYAFWRTELARRTLDGEPGYDHGFALLDASYGVGRYVVWELDGTTRDIAANVVDTDFAAPWPALLADFDGENGSFAQLANAELHRLGSAVPLYGAVTPDFLHYESGNVLLMSDFDDQRGVLSLAPPLPPNDPAAGTDDFGHPLRSARPVARDVGRYQRGFLGELPGFIYITAFDPATGSGRLEYQNTQLEFTSVIAEGVSDLRDTGDNLFYTIPYGQNAGVWVTRKK
jgi:hypothetical protein